MINETFIISPELKGGVGDYTRRLLEHLPPIAGLRVIVPKIGNRPVTSFAQYPVEEMNGSARDLSDRLPKAGGRVLVQYSAYGFNPRGYPRWLIRALLDWKKHSRGLLVIMFHEIWTFWPIWDGNRLLQRFHRSDLRRLMRVADMIFTSTVSQAKHLSDLSLGRPVEVLPVGSNIQPIETSEEKEKGLVVLFGSQPSRIRALRRMESSLKSLASSGRIRRIATVGAGKSFDDEDEELALLLRIELVDGFEQRGPLPDEKITALLSTAEFAISGQSDLSITKSSTFMAYAAHGLNILSCFADASKPEPLCLMTSPEELLIGVADQELQIRGDRLRQWQAQTSEWPHIARQFARALGV